MYEIESRFQIYVDDSVPLSFAHTHHQAVFGNSGVVDKNIYRAKVFFNLIDHLFGLFKVGGIRGITFYLDTQSSNLGFGCFAVFVDYQIGKSNICTFLCEFHGHGFSYTAGGTCDEGHFSFE